MLKGKRRGRKNNRVTTSIITPPQVKNCANFNPILFAEPQNIYIFKKTFSVDSPTNGIAYDEILDIEKISDVKLTRARNTKIEAAQVLCKKLFDPEFIKIEFKKRFIEDCAIAITALPSSIFRERTIMEYFPQFDNDTVMSDFSYMSVYLSTYIARFVECESNTSYTEELEFINTALATRALFSNDVNTYYTSFEKVNTNKNIFCDEDSEKNIYNHSSDHINKLIWDEYYIIHALGVDVNEIGIDCSKYHDIRAIQICEKYKSCVWDLYNYYERKRYKFHDIAYTKQIRYKYSEADLQCTAEYYKMQARYWAISNILYGNFEKIVKTLESKQCDGAITYDDEDILNFLVQYKKSKKEKYNRLDCFELGCLLFSPTSVDNRRTGSLHFTSDDQRQLQKVTMPTPVLTFCKNFAKSNPDSANELRNFIKMCSQADPFKFYSNEMVHKLSTECPTILKKMMDNLKTYKNCTNYQ